MRSCARHDLHHPVIRHGVIVNGPVTKSYGFVLAPRLVTNISSRQLRFRALQIHYRRVMKPVDSLSLYNLPQMRQVHYNASASLVAISWSEPVYATIPIGELIPVTLKNGTWRFVPIRNIPSHLAYTELCHTS